MMIAKKASGKKSINNSVPMQELIAHIFMVISTNIDNINANWTECKWHKHLSIKITTHKCF